eukprot:2695012-Pleurochrysis_carterae.AAC.1
MAIYQFLKDKYDAYKDMAEGNISRFDMLREYKMRATVPAHVVTYASPLAKSINLSRSEVQATFAKCVDKIAFVTCNKEDYETLEISTRRSTHSACLKKCAALAFASSATPSSRGSRRRRASKLARSSSTASKLFATSGSRNTALATSRKRDTLISHPRSGAPFHPSALRRRPRALNDFADLAF